MRCYFFYLLIFSSCQLARLAEAHPISVSDVFVEILPMEIQVRAEVFVEDLYLFHDLELIEPNLLPVAEIDKGASLHEAFLLERLKILNAAGEKLSGEMIRVDKADLPGRDIPQQHLMFFKIIYEMRFPISEPPEYLTFLQEFTHESVVLPAEVQLKLKPIYGRRLQQLLLPHQPWTVRLNNSAEAAAENEKRSPQERFEAMREEALGITSYGQTYAFLYRDPYQLRLEILIPLATLAGDLELATPVDGLIDVETQELLRPRIEKLFFDHVQIGDEDASSDESVSQILPGELQRIEFFGVTFRDFSRPVEAQPVSLANARIGIIIHYPLEQEQAGQLEWNLFNEFLYQLQLTVMTGEQTEQLTLRDLPEEKTFRWTGFVADSEQANGLSEQQQMVLSVNPPAGFQFREQIILAVLLMMVVTIVLFHFSSRSPGNRERQSLVTILFSVILLSFVGVFSQRNLGQNSQELLPAEKQADITRTILQQIYAAFNQRDEQSILQELEQVVAGPLLRDLYLEIRESMTIEEQGGALARTGKLDLIEYANLNNSVTAEAPHAVEFEARWQVPGTVEHWGHIHSRTTSYQAQLILAPFLLEDGETEKSAGTHRWKLTDISLLQLQQSVLDTSVRRF